MAAASLRGAKRRSNPEGLANDSIASPFAFGSRPTRNHILWSLSSCCTSADKSITGEWLLFFHQCDMALVSRATSPALCTIGTAQLLAYSVIAPSTM